MDFDILEIILQAYSNEVCSQIVLPINECFKYFIFSIMSFFGYQSFALPRAVQTSHRSVTAVHSAKDR
jgi:hypothetical protein